MNLASARLRSAADRNAAVRSGTWRQPVLLWALVMMVAMMSFYVHLLNEQVQRGEGLRQSQRSTADHKLARASAVKAGSRAIRLSENTAR